MQNPSKKPKTQLQVPIFFPKKQKSKYLHTHTLPETCLIYMREEGVTQFWAHFCQNLIFINDRFIVISRHPQIRNDYSRVSSGHMVWGHSHGFSENDSLIAFSDSPRGCPPFSHSEACKNNYSHTEGRQTDR